MGCPGWVPPALAVPDVLGGCLWITGCLWGAAGLGLSLLGTAEWVLGTRGPHPARARSCGHPVPATRNASSPLWSPPARMEKQTWWCEALCRVCGCSSCVSLGCRALGGCREMGTGGYPGQELRPVPAAALPGRACARRAQWSELMFILIMSSQCIHKLIKSTH